MISSLTRDFALIAPRLEVLREVWRFLFVRRLHQLASISRRHFVDCGLIDSYGLNRPKVTQG